MAFQEAQGENGLIAFKFQPECPKAEISISYRICSTVGIVQMLSGMLFGCLFVLPPSVAAPSSLPLYPSQTPGRTAGKTNMEQEFRSAAMTLHGEEWFMRSTSSHPALENAGSPSSSSVGKLVWMVLVPNADMCSLPSCARNCVFPHLPTCMLLRATAVCSRSQA